MRILSSPQIVESADRVVHVIVDTYLAPNRTLRDVRESLGDHAMDVLLQFSNACREELQVGWPRGRPPHQDEDPSFVHLGRSASTGPAACLRPRRGNPGGRRGGAPRPAGRSTRGCGIDTRSAPSRRRTRRTALGSACGGPVRTRTRSRGRTWFPRPYAADELGHQRLARLLWRFAWSSLIVAALGGRRRRRVSGEHQPAAQPPLEHTRREKCRRALLSLTPFAIGGAVRRGDELTDRGHDRPGAFATRSMVARVHPRRVLQRRCQPRHERRAMKRARGGRVTTRTAHGRPSAGHDGCPLRFGRGLRLDRALRRVASRRVALRGAYADLIECRQFSSLSIDGT